MKARLWRLLEDRRGTGFPGAHDCKQPSMSPGNQITAAPKLSFSHKCWDIKVGDHICDHTFPTEQSLQSHFFLQIFFHSF